VLQVIASREEGGPFKTLEDFARRIPTKTLNKKTLEALSKSGALDSLGERRAIIDNYESIVEFSKAAGGTGSQGDLFSSIGGGMEDARMEFPPTPPATSIEKLKWEKETLGMYVSSHPLAGLRKYIGKKAQLIGSLTNKEIGKRITLAGIEEGIKKLTTKKGESMAILTLEDPTGKMEVTLFPRVYADAAAIIEQPDTVLVVAGTLDLRAGQMQMRADAIKRASLSTMVVNAKKEGFFDEEEFRSGLRREARTVEEEQIELVDDEGNVIAGETVKLGADKVTDDFLGPLGRWIVDGMKIEDASLDEQPKAEPVIVERPLSDQISIHTIQLPPRAPRQLLLDLKRTFETFPGKERVQLKIGEQLIPVPLTITMSTILEKKIEELMGKYAAVSS
jgi:DNA polymerase III alpha subunit